MRPGDRQRPEAVDNAALHVLGDASGGAHPREQHTGEDETGDQEVDVADPIGGADRPAEDVAEDEQEHRPLDRRDEEQLRVRAKARRVRLATTRLLVRKPVPVVVAPVAEAVDGVVAVAVRMSVMMPPVRLRAR